MSEAIRVREGGIGFETHLDPKVWARETLEDMRKGLERPGLNDIRYGLFLLARRGVVPEGAD